MPTTAALLALSACLQVPAESRPASRPVPPPSRIAGEPEPAPWGREAPGRRVVPVRFRPITKVPYWSAEEAARHLAGDDLVIGLEIGGRAYCWPIKMLGGPQREIVNQELAGEPYVVNW